MTEVKSESGEVLKGSPACKRDSLAPAENVRMFAYEDMMVGEGLGLRMEK